MLENIEYMAIAFSLAKIAYKNGDVPVGAIIVNNDGNIIGQGYNSKEVNNNSLEHAEMVAIAQASKKIGQWRLNQCILYSTLEPCLMCVGAILHSRIKQVFFSLADPKFGSVVSKIQLLDKNEFNHQTTYKSGLLEEDVKKLMKKFFKEIRES